jgi:pyruvate formate lyase activating enzyme
MLDKPSTPPDVLARARRIAMKNGVRYAYTGNVYDPDGGTTYCHQCGQNLISRVGYDITGWNLTSGGSCAKCGAPCAGVFDQRPGTWGSRRLPVRLRDHAKI